MSVVYFPVLKTAVSYTVSFGRRWSLLEHMVLIELTEYRRTVTEIAKSANLPPRMIVEALINLLRASWVELRADDSGVFFAATKVGTRQAKEKELPVHLERDTKFTSLCFDLLTGSWLRSDDLKLVYKDELPNGARVIETVYQMYDERDGSFRDLLYLDADQSLEADNPRLSRSSRPYARVELRPGQVVGLPPYAPLRLRDALLELHQPAAASVKVGSETAALPEGDLLRDTITADDIIVGGDAHLKLVQTALEQAETAVVIHSCFVHAGVVRRLLPELEAAAKRKIQVELLWGLNQDPEDVGIPEPIKAATAVLDELPPNLRPRVHLSPHSSSSHAKLLIWDLADNEWRTAIGSCNYLSSWYDALDLSIVSSSQRLASRMLGWLLTAQLPAAESWSATARRLNRLWGLTHQSSAKRSENGEHELTLLVDDDHYACIRKARDEAKQHILITSDLYGVAAETSAVVPMESAAKEGTKIDLVYQRLKLTKLDKLHAKVLAWDDDMLAASSFNWLSTSVSGTRARGAEFGLLVRAPGISELLTDVCQQTPIAEPLARLLKGTS